MPSTDHTYTQGFLALNFTSEEGVFVGPVLRARFSLILNISHQLLRLPGLKSQLATHQLCESGQLTYLLCAVPSL